MTDKPILFSGPMARALLAGTKTQTRRVFPVPHNNPLGKWEPSTIGGAGVYDGKGRPFAERPCLWHTRTGDTLLLPFAVGDRLYVREAWRTGGAQDHLAPRDLPREWAEPIEYVADGMNARTGKFRQGMHMPRWASRLTLTVTDVRVQRLQDISEADAVAEGVPADYLEHIHGPGGYHDIWDHLNSNRSGCSWSDNPWVCAISFHVQKGNIDAL